MSTPSGNFIQKTYIYGLLEEDEDIIKYIGKANNPKRRMQQHICNSIKKLTAKDCWIQSILKRNKKIHLIILEEILDYDTWPGREMFWIKKYELQLKNHHIGGIGGRMIKYNMSYEDVKKWIKKNLKEIDSLSKWIKNIKNLPDFISSYPKNTYENRGWISWGDLLGTNRVADNELAKNYITYEEAKKYIQENKIIINNKKEWKIFTKKEEFPNFISKRPDRFYKNRGWISWRNFLCNKNVKTKTFNYLTLEECKKWIKENTKNINTVEKFRKTSSEFPDFIPKKPERYYTKTKEWTTWFDFLGKKNRDYINLNEAKELIKKYKIKSNKEWRVFVKTDEFKKLKIPSNPDSVYKNKGWISWNYFLDK